jgi:hypothetical protein
MVLRGAEPHNVLLMGGRDRQAMESGHLRTLLAEIWRRDETRPSLAMWLVRLLLIALALSAVPSSMLNMSGGKADAHPLTFVAENTFAAGIQPAALTASTVALGVYGDDLGALLRPAAPFHFAGSDENRRNAIDCLAAAGWYEAGDDANGQRSVMQVVLNRVRHPAFPSTICGVVFEGSQQATGCQFTFTCDGSLVRRHPAAWELADARKLAAEALAGAVDRSVGQATHYHADYVSPWWSSKMQQLSMVGLHIFYRWPGQFGALSTRSNSGAEAGFQTLAGRAIMSARMQPAADQTSGAALPAAPALALAEAKIQPPEPVSSLARPTSALFMAVEPATANGGWAVAALGKCAGRRTCQVIAYPSADAVDRNRDLAAPLRERPLFLFVRDGTSGMEVALWDCDRVSRPSASQCLPANSKALDDLMQERSD